MNKIFLNYDDQINKLKSNKIIIDDEQFAIKCLKEISYYALISGYKDSFRNKNTKEYNNVKFEDIYYLYKLDEELRSLFLKYILKIERKIKSHYSYFFCERFGESQKEYLNVNNYNYNEFQFELNKLSILLYKQINSNTYNYIIYNRDEYKNVPLWVLMNTLTFGNLSKMYSYSLSEIKINIANEFNLKHIQLSSMLNVISKFRNVCAHNERLYNYTTTKSIKNLPIHNNQNIKNKGKNNLFAIAICFKYLLDTDDFNNFLDELNIILTEYKQNSYNFSKVLRNMGFLKNWYNVLNSTKG
nr:Abi family protein [uncultured Tyzzerella sp.]